MKQHLSEAQMATITRFEKLYKAVSVLVCLAMIAVMLLTVSYLPPFGDPSNPANNEVPQRYIEQGVEETGVLNIVTAMILDYRAFDTFGEAAVLFMSVSAIVMILRREKEEVMQSILNTRPFEPRKDQIFMMVAQYLIPCVLLFGIYIAVNGHLSPGGGFSGGALLGAGLILWSSALGFESTARFMTERRFSSLLMGSMLFYALAKGYSFFTGANHIDSMIPLGQPGNILSAGLILPLNLAIALVVAVTIYGIFALFSRGGL